MSDDDISLYKIIIIMLMKLKWYILIKDRNFSSEEKINSVKTEKNILNLILMQQISNNQISFDGMKN